jgi:hypothetical protein
MTAFDLTTEDGRIAAAQEAGRNVARHELKEGHTEPRSWDKDGVQNARAFSHLAAAGFSRLGTRMFSIAFVDAYREEFQQGLKDVPEITPEDALAELQAMLAAAVRNGDQLSYKLEKEREEYNNHPAEDTKAIRDMTEIRLKKTRRNQAALNWAIQNIL